MGATRKQHMWLEAVALGLTLSACASGAGAHGKHTFVDERAGQTPQPASTSVGPMPPRTVLAAPAPASPEASSEGAEAGPTASREPAHPAPGSAPSPEDFTPQRSPLVANFDKGPQGEPPRKDPLWTREDARRPAVARSRLYYGTPYYGVGGLYGYRPYWGLGWGYGYGAYGAYGYPYFGPGVGIGVGWGGYRWGGYRGRYVGHHHGRYGGRRGGRFR